MTHYNYTPHRWKKDGTYYRKKRYTRYGQDRVTRFQRLRYNQWKQQWKRSIVPSKGKSLPYYKNTYTGPPTRKRYWRANERYHQPRYGGRRSYNQQAQQTFAHKLYNMTKDAGWSGYYGAVSGLTAGGIRKAVYTAAPYVSTAAGIGLGLAGANVGGRPWDGEW